MRKNGSHTLHAVVSLETRLWFKQCAYDLSAQCGRIVTQQEVITNALELYMVALSGEAKVVEAQPKQSVLNTTLAEFKAKRQAPVKIITLPPPVETPVEETAAERYARIIALGFKPCAPYTRRAA